MIHVIGKNLKIIVRADVYTGKIIAECDFDKGEIQKTVGLISPLIGKHAIYFEFEHCEDKVTFNRFTFDKQY